MKPLNVVILGGGGLHTPALFTALSGVGVHLGRICLVGRSAESVEQVGRFCRKVAHECDAPVGEIVWETDLARAAIDADVVLNMLGARTPKDLERDVRRLAMSGAVGHAATYPEALANLPPTLAAARIVEQVAPTALWVNFANPVTILCEAMALHTSLRTVGICYQAFRMRDDFAAHMGIESARLQVRYLGLNHIGWVTDILVDGASVIDELIGVLHRRRDGRYNYWYARDGLIPIDHAFCLYHRGDRWYDRQKGLRGSLSGVGIRLRLPPRDLQRERRNRAALMHTIAARDLRNLPLFAADAPWFAHCVVPFLAALADDAEHEFILTWHHKGQAGALPDNTAESAVRLIRRELHPIATSRQLPLFAAEWLRQVRASERLFIRAIIGHPLNSPCKPGPSIRAWPRFPRRGAWRGYSSDSQREAASCGELLRQYLCTGMETKRGTPDVSRLSAEVDMLDRELMHVYNQFAQLSVTFNQLMALLSTTNLVKGGVIMPVLFGLWFARGELDRDSRTRATLLMGFLGTLAGLTAVRILTYLLPFRPRPLFDAGANFARPAGIEDLLGSWTHSSSFPSDHAAFFAGLAATVFLVSRRLGIASFLYVCAVIFFPRLYLGLHYPTDILTGTLIGGGSVALCHILHNQHLGLRCRVMRMLAWAERYPGVFYGGFFILAFELAEVFDSALALSKFAAHFL